MWSCSRRLHTESGRDASSPAANTLSGDMRRHIDPVGLVRTIRGDRGAVCRVLNVRWGDEVTDRLHFRPGSASARSPASHGWSSRLRISPSQEMGSSWGSPSRGDGFAVHGRRVRTGRCERSLLGAAGHRTMECVAASPEQARIDLSTDGRILRACIEGGRPSGNQHRSCESFNQRFNPLWRGACKILRK